MLKKKKNTDIAILKPKKTDFWNKRNICPDFFVNLHVFVTKKNGMYTLIKYLITIYDTRQEIYNKQKQFTKSHTFKLTR